ncbi:STAS domain-containing protein [Aquabacterium sp. A7-Y]|uniref:STAS domain-containing protein n=1 Tax=Aquabacterium sp. A7-Y TaxID=1349605 RepID=UPI00223E05D4|nr:STAS domain-containing protein [Aquabacterium sp. A7-Y]MCW7538057.1 STAS domain-containing protein [Aquabacterium sp. A7-Y]
MRTQNTAIQALLQSSREDILKEWLAECFTAGIARKTGNGSMEAEAASLLKTFHEAVRADGDPAQFQSAAWDALRSELERLSGSRAAQGASAGDTSVFVLALKKPLFERVQRSGGDTQTLMELTWWISMLVDKMAQFTVSTYQRTREDIIRRQQQELLELSTPVIKLWDGVLAVPMIGTLDSARTQLVMETLLQRIVESGSELAIIDITGVPTVDTLVAQHLLKTVTAIRLMGADCIVSGIRPQIAQTIVHLGIDLQGINTKATLADALALALKRTGHTVTRTRA